METFYRWVPGDLDSKIRNKQNFQFILVFSPALGIIPIVLLIVDQFAVRTVFLLLFIWMLISSEIFAPRNAESLWWKRLQWIKILGWIIMMLIIVERIILYLE